MHLSLALALPLLPPLRLLLSPLLLALLLPGNASAEGTGNSSEEGSGERPAIYILTLAGSEANQQRFAHCAKAVESLSYDSATRIDGFNYHDFYPSDLEVREKGWGLERVLAEKQAANRAIFKEFRRVFKPSFAFPAGFEEDAVQSLFPGQLAVYLGHWMFWEKAARKTEGRASVVLEDDAQLLATPSQLKGALEHEGTGAGAVELLGLGSCRDQPLYMDNTMGYALTPATARLLLRSVDGKIPVDWAINMLSKASAISGRCSSPPLMDWGFGADQSTKAFIEIQSHGELHRLVRREGSRAARSASP